MKRLLFLMLLLNTACVSFVGTVDQVSTVDCLPIVHVRKHNSLRCQWLFDPNEEPLIVGDTVKVIYR